MRKLIRLFYGAFTLLTRIPLPHSRKIVLTESDLTGSVLFFPLVGLFYGGLLYACLILGQLLHLSPEITAFVILAIPYLLNRFFHLDGLSDLLDGFLADRDAKTRLEIMKDSRIGSYALGGVSLYLLLKWILLKELVQDITLSSFIILIPMISRYSMVLLAALSKYPRDHGTGKILIGQLSKLMLLLSTFIFLLLTALTAVFIQEFRNLRVLFLIASILPGVLAFRFWSHTKIGGVTGDGLGAFNELSELMLLILCPILLKSWV